MFYTLFIVLLIVVVGIVIREVLGGWDYRSREWTDNTFGDRYTNEGAERELRRIHDEEVRLEPTRYK